MKGLFFEEFVAGQQETFGSCIFSRDTILNFARRYDPQPFHIDEEAAKQSHFGALCASGWHTAACWMKCFVTFNQHHRELLEKAGSPLPEMGPSPGFENLRWLRPVYVDDTITYGAVITSKRRLASRPGWGIVFSQNTGINQKSELAFSFDGKLLVQCRT